MVQGGRNINFKILGRIASGWVTTPIIAALIAFIALFFLQNTFNIKVYKQKPAQQKVTLINKNSTNIKKNAENMKFEDKVYNQKEKTIITDKTELNLIKNHTS